MIFDETSPLHSLTCSMTARGRSSQRVDGRSLRVMTAAEAGSLFPDAVTARINPCPDTRRSIPQHQVERLTNRMLLRHG